MSIGLKEKVCWVSILYRCHRFSPSPTSSSWTVVPVGNYWYNVCSERLRGWSSKMLPWAVSLLEYRQSSRSKPVASSIAPVSCLAVAIASTLTWYLWAAPSRSLLCWAKRALLGYTRFNRNPPRQLNFSVDRLDGLSRESCPPCQSPSGKNGLELHPFQTMPALLRRRYMCGVVQDSTK